MTIDRNSDGEPTGIFIDQNTYPTVEFNLMRVVPRFTHAQTVEALKRSMALYNSVGTDNKPYSPFATLWAAVARTERGTGTVLGPEQRLSRMDALRAFTMGGAYFCS